MDETNESDVRPSLLLTDDDRVLCEVLAKALEKRGFRVTVAHDCRSALATTAANPPQFAVVDLKLPDGSGLDLLKKLMELCPQTRVVVLTGYGSIASAIESVKLGAYYYLTKPVSADDIVAELRSDTQSPQAQLAPIPVCEKRLSVNRLEWEYINRVLSGTNGNISATARLLGMHRRTLQRKLSKHPVRG